MKTAVTFKWPWKSRDIWQFVFCWILRWA